MATHRELGEIATSAGTRASTVTSLPVYSVTKHRGFVPSLEYFKKQVYSRDLAGYQIVESGEFAYATIHLDEGSIGIAPERCLISPMYTAFRVASTEVHPPYLLRYMKSARAIKEYSRLGQGSAERRRSISFDRLGQLKIPVPTMGEQRRIADILDRADTLRAKRREALAHLDDLTQSIFLDMFGEPLENDRDWPVAHDGHFVAGFESGKNLVADEADNQSATYRVLKVSAVTSGRFRASESKALPDGYVPPKHHLVRDGDLLFSRANTTELVGATALVTRPPARLAMPDKLWRFVWHEELRADPIWVWHLFRQPAFRGEIGRRATGTSGSMQNISKPKVLSIAVGLPPLSIQQAFAGRIVAVERIRSTTLIRSELLDALFASLQQRSFAGRL